MESSTRNQKICVVLGTRPEIIKMMPIIQACEDEGRDYFIIHSGQHYSYEMDAIFFEELGLPTPHYNIAIGSGAQGEQTGAMLREIELILQKEKPGFLLVQGDTNTVLAGALAAVKLHIPIGHVEAGLRSFDRRMPEEINRILTDHMSDYLFAPTEETREHLLAEGIADEKIHVTGNTIVDAVLSNAKAAESASDVLDSLELEPQSYGMITLHRAENVDNEVLMGKIVKGINGLKRLNTTLVWPMHPRTRKGLEDYKLLETVEKMDHVRIIEPAGFLDFLMLESNAKFLLTDSGGVQEEACILQVPCVTLRDSTERPETVTVGANRLVGSNPTEILKAVQASVENAERWDNPLGDGQSARRILNILDNNGSKLESKRTAADKPVVRRRAAIAAALK